MERRENADTVSAGGLKGVIFKGVMEELPNICVHSSVVLPPYPW